MIRTTLATATFLLCGAAAGAVEEARGGGQEAPSFDRDIAPILSRRCAGCHGPEDEKAGLDVTSLERLLRGGKSGAAIVPGKGAESLLVAQITRTDAKVMPPPKAGKPLGAEEVALIRAWIDGGAKEGGRSATPGGREPRRTAAIESAPQDAGPVASAAFSPAGDILLLGRDRLVSVLDAESGREVARLDGAAELVRAIAFREDGARVAAAGGLPGKEGEVLLWDRAAPGSPWKLAGAVHGHADAIHAVALTKDGARIVTGSYDRLIKVWDARTLAETATLKDHLDAVFAIALSPDGSRALSASGDRTVKVWDLDASKRLLTLSDATLGLNTIAVAPSGSIAAAGGQDRMIRLWKIEEGSAALLHSFFAHEGSVLRIAYSPDGKSIYSAGEDGLLKAWRVDGLTERLLFEKQPDWVLGLAVRPDGRTIAAGRYDGSWAVYDADTGKKLLGSDVPRPVVVKSGGEAETAGAAKTAAGDAETPEQGKKKRGLLVDVVDAGSVTVPPSLGGHWPRAVRRGQKATLSIDGRNLSGAEISFYEPGFKARIVKNETLPRPEFRRQPGATGAEIVDLSTPHKLEVEVEVAPDARPGMHRFLALTPAGVTNALALFVEHRGEANETEPNDALAEAGELSAAALSGEEAVLGSMGRSGDADVFRLEAKAGDEVVFHILSQSIGSGLNGLLEILGPDGAVLATSADRRFGNLVEGRVAHRFETAGRHFLRITDKSFAAGGFYRLYAESAPLVTSVFPPGLQAGTKATISVKGFHIRGGMQVEVEAPAKAGWGATVPLPIPGAIGGASVAVGEAPEAMEEEPNDSARSARRVEAPVTVNGVLEKDGGSDEDFFLFRAEKGRELIIDVVASRIGSLLDSVIEVLDPAGRPIERATLRCVAQTFITLSDRDSRSVGLRLDSQTDLRVNDFIMVGSEVLKIRQLPDYPDEDTLFFGQGGVRAGYLDTTPEYHAVNDPVYKVESHPPGTEFPPNGMPVFRLTYRNDDGGPPVHEKDSRIHFTAPSSGDYVVRIRDIQGRTGPDFYYRLQIREPRPDFRFSVDAENINIPQGGRVPFSVSSSRLDDFNGPIEVALDGELPPGFSLETAPILPDSNEAILTLKAGAGAESTSLDRTFRLRARAVAGGREIVREGSFRMLRVTGAPDLALTMEPRVIRLKPGGTADVTVRAVRQNGFRGRIPLEVPNLPHGVAVMDTGLNDILIPEHEDVRVYRLRAETWAAPMERRTYTIGRTETTSPLPTKFSTEPATLVIEDPDAVAKKEF